MQILFSVRVKKLFCFFRHKSYSHSRINMSGLAKASQRPQRAHGKLCGQLSSNHILRKLPPANAKRLTPTVCV
jgi:hypothetical protein